MIENLTPEQFEQWLAVLGKPTMGVVAFIVLILYRDSVMHLINIVVDVVGSRLKRRT